MQMESASNRDAASWRVDGASRPTVSVLLPTYNGAPYVEAQIESLTDNRTPFTLHWLDDFSSDETSDVVREAARCHSIGLREWHQTRHLGFPATFFRLVECAESDVYLFCDQDDLWQPGKIDATVAALSPHLQNPALCFSMPLWFQDGRLDELSPPSKEHLSNVRSWMRESRIFTLCPSMGNTIGFTRPLRDLYMDHKDIAASHAIDHDWWFYILASVTGTVSMLADVPTTLYRRHSGNATNEFILKSGKNRLRREWEREQAMRKRLAQQARGFVLALPMLPPSLRRDRLLSIAQQVSLIDRRRSVVDVIRLAQLGAMSRWWGRLWLRTVACLCSDA